MNRQDPRVNLYRRGYCRPVDGFGAVTTTAPHYAIVRDALLSQPASVEKIAPCHVRHASGLQCRQTRAVRLIAVVDCVLETLLLGKTS